MLIDVQLINIIATSTMATLHIMMLSLSRIINVINAKTEILYF